MKEQKNKKIKRFRSTGISCTRLYDIKIRMLKSKILLKTRQQCNSKRDQRDMNKCSGKGGSISRGVTNLLREIIFAENCMNMK